MTASKILEFHVKQSKELFVTGEFTADLSLDLNESSKNDSEYLLIQHYVLSKYGSKNSLFINTTRCDLDLNEGATDVSHALFEFIQSDKTTAYIIISVYNKAGLGHCVYLHAEKKSSNTMVLEYVDPYGAESPYGNPHKQLSNAISTILNNSPYKNFLIISSDDKQQNATNSCFVITYQNMLDKLEHRSQKTIAAVKNGAMDYDSINLVRAKMQKDLKWLKVKYDEALHYATQHAEKMYPEMAKERKTANEIYINAGRPFELFYDPKKYGHSLLTNEEIHKCAELLANIDFSQAPSQTCSVNVQLLTTGSVSKSSFWPVTPELLSSGIKNSSISEYFPSKQSLNQIQKR